MIFELGNKRLIGEGKYWVASSANVIGDVTLKNESSVWFNAVIRGDIENITVGEGSNIQDNSVLHTDKGFPLKIGKMVTVGHLVMLHGCTIMDNRICSPEACTSMAEVRAGVDALDADLARLLGQRFAYMRAAARIKPERHLVRDEARLALEQLEDPLVLERLHLALV